MAYSNPHMDAPGQTVEAATRFSRFWARLIDIVVWFAPLPLLLLSCLGGVAALGLFVAIFIGQLWLLVRGGQTIGKKFMKIYIMRSNGNIPNFGWIILREFAIPVVVGACGYSGHNDPTLVGQVFQAFIGLIGLIDILFIFGPSRRCLHDFIAGTHVVKAE